MVSLSSCVFYLYLTISLKVEMYISEIDYTKFNSKQGNSTLNFIRNAIKIFQFNCTIPVLVVKLIIKKRNLQKTLSLKLFNEI